MPPTHQSPAQPAALPPVPRLPAGPFSGGFPRVGLRAGADVERAYNAAQAVVEVHRRLAEWMKPGLTLMAIDHFIARQLEDLQCRSCFLGYKVPRKPPFPSHACLSLNHCVVHGTAGYHTQPLVPGDLLKVDIGVYHQGFIGDAGWSYGFKEVSPEIRRLMDCGKLALARGIERLRSGAPLIEFARAVQECVETEHGYHLVRGLGGHGYGRKLHESPYISNVAPSFDLRWEDANWQCAPGSLLAVEPMIGLTSPQTTEEPRRWPVYIADGSPSVHHEHDVLISETAGAPPIVLTHGLDDLPDIVG